MDPKPVEQKTSPKYPTRRQLLKGGAAMVFLGPAVGCDFSTQGAVGPRTPDESTVGEMIDPKVSQGTLVAPIFEHGEGRGGFGCVAVSPPAFLSEDEAIQILKEELSSVGITLDVNLARELPGVKVDCTSEESKRELERYRENNEVNLDVVPTSGNNADEALRTFKEIMSRDLYDKTHPSISSDAESSTPPVAVQFITHKDCLDYEPYSSVWCSAYSCNSKETAGRVADAIREQSEEEMFVGVFYDPFRYCPKIYELIHELMEGVQAEPGSPAYMEAYRNAYDEVTDEVKGQSLEEVRLQAKDFVAWLKEQGAI